LEAARLLLSRLVWVDLPMRGPREGKPGRPQGTTLGGVLGEVLLADVGAEAAALLALLENFHVGSNVHFCKGSRTSSPPKALRPRLPRQALRC
jgi:hypothetical protein